MSWLGATNRSYTPPPPPGGVFQHGVAFSLPGPGLGTKSGGTAALYRDKNTATLGTVDPQWDIVEPNVTGSNSQFNILLKAPSFAPTGNTIGVPHPFVPAFYGGCHGFQTGVALGAKFNIPAPPFIVYGAYFRRSDPGTDFTGSPPLTSPSSEWGNNKIFSYNDVGGVNTNSVLTVNPSQPINNTQLRYQISLADNNNAGNGAPSIQTPDANGHSQFWSNILSPFNPTNGWIFCEYELFATPTLGLAGGGYVQYRENGGALLINYAGSTDAIAAFNGNTTTRHVTVGQPFYGSYGSANNWTYLADLYMDMTGTITPGSHVARVTMFDAAGTPSIQDLTSWADSAVTGVCWKGKCQAGPVTVVAQCENGTTKSYSGTLL